MNRGHLFYIACVHESWIEVGRRSSHWIKTLSNLPHLVLKAGHPSDSDFCIGHIHVGVPDQALGWLPLRVGISYRR